MPSPAEIIELFKFCCQNIGEFEDWIQKSSKKQYAPYIVLAKTSYLKLTNDFIYSSNP
jgi:hypothetical protein